MKRILSALSLLIVMSVHAQTETQMDATMFVQNASCSENYGWNKHSENASAEYSCHNPEFDSDLYMGRCVEAWFWQPLTNATYIWQDIEGLMAGTYTVSAYCVGQVYNDAANKGKNVGGLYFFANGERVKVSNTTWQDFSLTVRIANGEKLRIGIVAGNDNKNDWTGIANVRLICESVDDDAKVQGIYFSETSDVRTLRASQMGVPRVRLLLPQGETRTLCLPFSLDEQATAELFSDVEEIISLKRKTGATVAPQLKEVKEIKQGVPYIVKANKDIEGIEGGKTVVCDGFRETRIDTYILIPVARRYRLSKVYTYDTGEGVFLLKKKHIVINGFEVYIK